MKKLHKKKKFLKFFRSYLNKALFLGTFSLILSCGSTWVVRQSQDGGVIGYKGYTSGKKASEAIAKKIPCPDFEIVNDELISQNFSYTLNTPVNTESYSSGHIGDMYYSGNTTNTTYVPTTHIGTSYWREATYVCKSNKFLSDIRETVSKNRELSSSTDLSSCVESCIQLASEKKLKNGLSAETCVLLTCSKK
jgi:hypothetical protein